MSEKKQSIKKIVKSGKDLDIVLVGTYKEKQLDWIKKNGIYNYPVKEGDKLKPELCGQIKELWLYAGSNAKRHAFKSEFIGIQTRDEFIDANPTYPKLSKSKHTRYLVFRVSSLYGVSSLENLTVFARISDFAGGRAKNIVKSIKDYQNGGELGTLANYLPNDLSKLTKKQLQLCETVQLDFFDVMRLNKCQMPRMEALRYVKGGIQTIAPSVSARQFRLGEFFCGPGGLACGALSAKIEIPGFEIIHAWASDYDRDTCNTYAENICYDEPETVICQDVRTLDLNDFRLTEIDGFAFGFPCNDFSVVGERKGVDGCFGPLYQYGVAVLNKFKPQWFVAENVGGLASANEGGAFKKILESMKTAGYRVYPHLYKFEEYGVPQARHRIIIVGIRSNLKFEFRPPSPKLLEKRDNSAKAALENPPIPKNALNNDRTVQHSVVVERLKYIRPGENAFTAKLPQHLQLNVKGAKISQIYKRLDPNKPAYTVTGSGGGGTHIYHYEEPRSLTNRERARLQTFPDNYLFLGSKESVRKQIGMAVPPRGAQIIFEALLRTFAGISYDSVACNISDSGEFR